MQMASRPSPTERRTRTPVHRPGDAGNGKKPRRGLSRQTVMVILIALAANYFVMSLLVP